MFIRTLEDVKNLNRYRLVPRSKTSSARILTVEEGMGISLHVNRGEPIRPVQLWYKHHWEANYLISGALKIKDLSRNKEWLLGPGDIYSVGPNDRHLYEVLENEHHISIFSPPLNGNEVHDQDGTYPASGDVPVTDRCMFVRNIEQMRGAGQELTVVNGQARVVRAITKSDGMGFSLSDVLFAEGASTQIWYKHHWATNYIISGTGSLTDSDTGESRELKPDMVYSIGPKDRCQITMDTDMHLLSVISPPIEGTEQHDEDGSLEANGPVPPGPPGY